MKCKRHPYELGVGVCASCLRERLLAVIAAREGRSQELRRHLDPPPFALPRTGSPYVSHRRSVGSGRSPSSSYTRPPHCRFFSTPQVGPTFRSETTADNSYSFGSYKKSRGKKFSLFSTLFGLPRSDEAKPSKSSSWISGLIPGRRKKNPKPSRSKSFKERGMSPARDDEDNDSVCSSGYSTESSTGWRRPEPTPVRKFPSSSSAAAARNGRGVSGFAVCLSPLVRPSSKTAADSGISGDMRGSLGGGPHNHRRQVSAGAGSLLLPCRSRKLADFGRFR